MCAECRLIPGGDLLADDDRKCNVGSLRTMQWHKIDPGTNNTERCLATIFQPVSRESRKSARERETSTTVLDVQIGHHFAKIRQGIVIRVRIDVREILAGVSLDEARIISA